MRGPTRRAPRALLLSLPVLLVAAAGVWWAWNARAGSAEGAATPPVSAPRSTGANGSGESTPPSPAEASTPLQRSRAQRQEIPADPAASSAHVSQGDADDPRRWACSRVQIGSGGGPVEGADIEVWVRAEEGSTRRFHGRSDAAGFFCIECVVPGHWVRDDGVTLGVEWGQRIWAPGWKANTAGPHLYEEPLSEARSWYSLGSRGGMLRGRVVDAEGHPVHQATLNLVRARADGSLSRGRCGSTQSNSNGEFDLAYGEAGRYAVLAQDVRGVARSPAREFDPQRDESVGELQLVGIGQLSGLATTPDSDPVAGLELGAISLDHVDLDTWDEDRAPPAEVLTALQLLQSADGLVLASARTDRQGRFRFIGLRPGRYAVFTRHRRIPPARCLASTGDERVLLHVEHHELRVELDLDEELLALEAAQHMGRRLLYCQPTDAEAHPDPDASPWDAGGGLDRQTASTMQHALRFEVAPGRRYQIGITDTALRGQRVVHGGPLEIDIPPGQYRTTVHLPLSASAAGSLVLDVRGELDRSDLVRALILRHDSGAVVAILEGDASEPICSDALPVGEYRVRATLRAPSPFGRYAEPWMRAEERWQELRRAAADLLPWPDWLTAASVISSFRIECEASTEIRAGEARSVDLAFPVGGRLLLRIPAAADDAPSNRDSLRQATTVAATVFLGQRSRRIEFGRIYPEGTAPPAEAFDQDGAAWFLGDTALPAGSVHVVVRTDQGECTGNAVLRAGQLCVLELR